MSEKPLHEKKISDFDFKQKRMERQEKEGIIALWRVGEPEGYEEAKQDFKEWAIAVVKELETGITLEDAEDYIEADKRKYLIKFLIDRFELTEEDLK